jgi:hypothetical protein
MNFQQKRDAANNPNTPIHILEKLSNDKDCFVRYYVAKNPSTPINLLETLATERDYGVRYTAAMNPKATEIVKRLFLMTQSKYS